MKKLSIVLSAAMVLAVATGAGGDTIVKPHTFTAGDPALASEVNSNFDTVYDQVNKIGGAVNVDGTTGNVGIGKAPTVNKLDVDGKVAAISFSGDGSGLSGINDGDNDPANELITSVGMSGTTLNVDDAGGTQSVDLAEKLGVGDLSDAKTDSTSIFIGPGAGASDDGTNNNTAVGKLALTSNTSGFWNVAFGKGALEANSSGYGNTSVGTGSLPGNNTGYYNVAVGNYALFFNTNGSNNTGIGTDSLSSNTSGVENVGIGVAAGALNETGNGNVFLGYNAGYNETGSNKLYIDNSTTGTPLIHGDFSTNALTINGTLTSTDNAAIGTTVVADRKLNVSGGVSDTHAGYFSTADNDGDAYGIEGIADGLTDQGLNYLHYGVSGSASGAKENVGVNGDATGSGGYINYGVKTLAENASVNYGGFFDARNAVGGSTTNYGVQGYAGGATSNYGVRGYVADYTATTNYGVYGYAVGASTNRGVWGQASTVADSYAGYFSGNVYVTDDVSAFSFTDRTPYPKDLATAYASVLSMQRLPDGEYEEDNKGDQLDHSALHEFVRSSDGEHRDLSATVSAQNEVIKDLIKQNEALKMLVCQDHPEAAICIN